MTLYVHEVHSVVGAKEDDFEAIYRDSGGWMETHAKGEDARLLYFAHQAHGTGLSYRVVTITAVADGAAWERMALRVAEGDLRDLALQTDEYRHAVKSKVMLAVPWSPLRDVNLGEVPTTPAEHETSLFMEDTGWPSSTIQAYLEFWEKDYHPMLQGHPEKMRLLEIQACWVPAFGAGPRPEGVLWQRVHNLDILIGLFSREIPRDRREVGGYMDRALKFRDQWESRLLRTAPWSPRW